jgi:hypothetical protein
MVLICRVTTGEASVTCGAARMTASAQGLRLAIRYVLERQGI